MMTEIMHLKEENSSLSSKCSTLMIQKESGNGGMISEYLTQIQSLKSQLVEQEKEFSRKIEKVYIEKKMSEQNKVSKIEEFIGIMAQMKQMEERHSQQIYAMRSEWSQKEAAYQSKIVEYRSSSELNNSSEIKYTQQIERMNMEFSR